MESKVSIDCNPRSIISPKKSNYLGIEVSECASMI